MSEDTIEKLLLLALGWLLGMLGPVVTEAIKRRRENSQVKVALAAELREVSYKLALGSYLVNLHFGTVDRSYLQWLQRVTASYKGPSLVETRQRSFEIQLNLPDQKLAAWVQDQAGREGQNIVVQKIMVPLLDARVSSLWHIENRVQIILFDIRSNINLLNELVDRARYYTDLTFKLEGGNYKLVVGNLESCHRQYAERARRIVSKIEELSGLV